jgi:hypothetical protein
MILKEYNLHPGQIGVDQKMVAKPMGLDAGCLQEPYRGIVHQCLAESAHYKNIRGGYRITERIGLDRAKKTITAEGITFYPGEQVFRYLEHSEMMAFFVCTAGNEVSDRTRELNQAGQYLEGYITDLIGSILVEKAMDIIHNMLRADVKESGLQATNRYSPGYCHWKVDEQRQLFRLFPAGFCGVRLSDSALMNPIKSVSGVIGIGKNVGYREYICDACTSVNCIYRDLRHGN